jgi:hypothetical protein
LISAMRFAYGKSKLNPAHRFSRQSVSSDREEK